MMANVRQFLTCVGDAVCAHGLKALAGLIPFGAVLFDVAEQVCRQLREAKQDDQLQQLLAAAQADPQADADAVAAVVAAGQPPELRQKLATYLAQVPALLRQSFRRPSDPTGRSVPRRFSLRHVEEVLALLPARLPRFRVGDRPPGQGDWELCELLGVGGFGEVWKARHRVFDGIAPVALKFCLDPDARERLLKHEASVLNQVMRHGRHPGIVPLLDASLSTDPPCLRYEYVEGGDLSGLVRDWPADAGPRWRLATAVIHMIAEVVAFAHRLTPAIVHRDLKPANVLIQRGTTKHTNHTKEDNEDRSSSLSCRSCVSWFDGLVRVTDFGIGGVVANPLTTLRGSHTPLYASPQQARGDPPDPRDDVHALGVIWYQLLTGDLHGGPTVGLWADDLADEGVPADVVALLGSCVARPDKRPADAGVLAEQLASLLTPTAAAHDARLEQFLRTGKSGTVFGMLDLTNKRIGDAGVIALAQSPRLANLSVLILSGCQLTDVGVQALAASPHVLNLTRLDLWDNHVGDAGVTALAECPFLEHLGHLDLGRNRVGDAGAKALASSPHLRHLAELLLVSNHIGDEGALALAASPTLATLAWLKPLDNRITAVGADALKRAFGKRVRIM